MDNRELLISNTLSNKNFGFIFSGIFAAITVYCLVFKEYLPTLLIYISIAFFITAILFPRMLGPLNKLWFFFGQKIGSIISKIIMFIIYSLTIVPIGLIFKVLKKDILNIKMNPKSKSYWVEKEEIKSSIKNQF